MIWSSVILLFFVQTVGEAIVIVPLMFVEQPCVGSIVAPNLLCIKIEIIVCKRRIGIVLNLSERRAMLEVDTVNKIF